MDFATTSLFYLVIGLAVAVAVRLKSSRQRLPSVLFRIGSAILFWPVFLPWLLQANESVEPCAGGEPAEPATAAPCEDEIARAIDQVETELESALSSLDGWAESALDGAAERLSELRAAWRHQAARIRELDQLLERPEFDDERQDAAFVQSSEERDELEQRISRSQRSRQANLQKLKSVRQQLYRDLMGTLAWVRELVTMIHLAKYTGAPASRAQELVGQIAAAVEGLSEVSAWNQPAASAGSDQSVYCG